MITTSKKFLALSFFMGTLFTAGATQNAQAATTGTANAGLQVNTIAEITVDSSALQAFTPARADYVTGSMVQANAISLNVFCNTGYSVTVDGQANGATLNSSDLFVTRSGQAYAGAISAPRTVKSSVTASAATGDDVSLDVKVNLAPSAYAPNGSPYTNTMVFTVTAAS